VGETRSQSTLRQYLCEPAPGGAAARDRSCRVFRGIGVRGTGVVEPDAGGPARGRTRGQGLFVLVTVKGRAALTVIVSTWCPLKTCGSALTGAASEIVAPARACAVGAWFRPLWPAACWHGSHDMNTTPRVADSEGGHTPRRQGRAGASPGPAADPTAGREKQINMELNWIQACQACPVVTSARVSRREWAGRGPRLGRADKLET